MSRDVVRRALMALSDRLNGLPTAEDVVEEARAATSPLHPFFTWDNRQAAHKQRLWEARHLLSTIRIEVTTRETSFSAPVFYRDPSKTGDQQGYVSLARLQTDEDLARATIVAEFSRVAAALRRAQDVARVLNLSGEIDQMLEGVTSVLQVVQPIGGIA